MIYHNRFKKALVWGLLLLVGFSAVGLMVVSVQSVPVNAVEINGVEQGDRGTMYKKIAYGAFENCVNDAKKDTFDYEVISGIDLGPLGGLGWSGIKSSKLRGGNWFMDGGESYGVGGLLERLLVGNYDDGRIYCGEKSNALMSKFVNNTEYLNLKDSYADILCNGNDFRILKKGSISGSCIETLNDPDGHFMSPTAQLGGGLGYSNDISVDTSKEDYLDLIVKEKAFGGSIPGGSLYELTDLEQYFLLNDTFINVCTSDKNGSDDSSLTYGIFVRDSNTGELVKKYFPAVSKPKKGTEIPIRKKGTTVVKMSCKEIAKTLGDEDSAEVKAYKEYIKQVPVENEERQPTSAADDQVCYDNSGALGWIICPIIEGTSRVGTAAWEFIEGNFLQIRASELFQSGSGLELVWQRFRDIANVVFIILFIFVIFSQLTGVGIDNYGIKKIMPRLIVVAILVNLSFLICALAVDVSNILGSGLNALFTSFAGDIPSNVASLQTATASGGSILAVVGISAGGIVLFGLLNPVGALTLGGVVLGIGLAVLGIVISIAFSILFMFLILIIRNAGIVVLIAISPVAIVCYMLPNTEKLFKRWFELLKALLVVYPICGAVIGAGRLAGNLVASIPDSPGMAIAGMVMNVLPFFLVPMLLKQSLRLMGNIGASLTSFGKNAGRRTSGFARNKITGSEKVKDWSQYQKTLADSRRANRIMRRLSGRTGLSEREQDRLRKAQDVVVSRDREKLENKRRAESGYYEAVQQEMKDDIRRKEEATRVALMMRDYGSKTSDELVDEWDKAFEGGETEKLSALTTVIHRRFGAAGVNGIASKLSEKRNIGGNSNYVKSMEVLQRTMNENSSLAGDMKAKASDAFQMISNGGIAKGDDGKIGYQDMSFFTENNKIATKSKDWITASVATLQRGLDSGAIDDEMLTELLNSDDPAIEAFRSDKGVREALRAAKYNREHNPGGVGPNLPAADAASKYMEEQEAKRVADEATKQSASQASIETAIRNVFGSSPSSPTPVPTPASGSTAIPEGFAEYDNISGRSSMILREMPDGTLQDSSGNTYSAARWKRAGRVESGADSSRPQPQRQTQPQPRPQSQPIQIQNTGAGGMPQTRSGIVLPGDTSQISKLAEQARKSNNNNNGQ